MQAEVVDALRELQRVKKCYHDFSHIASIAREKTADAQARSVFQYGGLNLLLRLLISISFCFKIFLKLLRVRFLRLY